MRIEFKATYKTKKIINDLLKSNKIIKHNLKVGLDKSLDYAVKRSKNWYLSGLRSRHLHSRTGKLRSTIGRTDSRWYAGQLTGSFGSGLSGFPSADYAAVHEFGFFGSEQVREHIRMHAHTFGYFGPPHPFPVLVNAYTRLMSIKARRYLLPALTDMEKTNILKGNLDLAVEAGLDGVKL